MRHCIIICRQALRQIRIADDGRQDVVEIMGNSASQRADCLHLLRLTEFQFQFPLAGDIPGYGYIIDDDTMLVPDGGNRGIRFIRGTILFSGSYESGPDVFTSERFPHLPDRLLAVCIASEYPGIQAYYFVPAIAGHELECRIHICEAPECVGHEDRFRGLFNGRCQPRALFFTLLAFY